MEVWSDADLTKRGTKPTNFTAALVVVMVKAFVDFLCKLYEELSKKRVSSSKESAKKRLTYAYDEQLHEASCFGLLVS